MAAMSSDVRWRLPHGVAVAFSTRTDGDVRDPLRRQAWLAGLGVTQTSVVVRQLHGSRVVTAVPGPAAPADGLTTTRQGPPLVVFGADCPGLCLAAPDALGVAHCGWRGVAGGIVATLIESLAAHTRHPRSTWQAFIGPVCIPMIMKLMIPCCARERGLPWRCDQHDQSVHGWICQLRLRRT